MSRVTTYATFMCGFCHRAKKLLTEKGVDFEETDVTYSPTKRREMTELAESRTVPQIFVGGDHLGDSQKLYELEKTGQLDRILGGAR